MNDERDGIPGRQHSPLRADNDGHKYILKQKFKEFRDRKGLTYKEISRDMWALLNEEEKKKQEEEPWRETYLRRFVSDYKSISPSNAQMNLMYRYLDKQDAWDQRAASRSEVKRIEDATYFSLLEFFDVAEMTTTNLLRRLPGIYRVYRPVLTHPDHFVSGFVRIWSDTRRGLLYYEEYNAIQKMNGREPKHITLQGYAFKKSNFVSLFASDTSKSSIHITTFTSCQIQDDKYIILFGGFFDTLGKQVYSGKVFMERIQEINDDEETFESLKEDARCVDRHNVPPSILTFFDSDSAASGGITLF